MAAAAIVKKTVSRLVSENDRHTQGVSGISST
jgi:hypothetical protein